MFIGINSCLFEYINGIEDDSKRATEHHEDKVDDDDDAWNSYMSFG